MSEKKVGFMSRAINWQEEIGAIAGPFDGNRKGWLSRAARKANLSYRQIKALYYGESKNPRHAIAASVLGAAQQAKLEEARRDALEVADFFDQRAAALANIDPDFHRSEIDAFLSAARVLSGRDRA